MTRIAKKPAAGKLTPTSDSSAGERLKLAQARVDELRNEIGVRDNAIGAARAELLSSLDVERQLAIPKEIERHEAEARVLTIELREAEAELEEATPPAPTTATAPSEAAQLQAKVDALKAELGSHVQAIEVARASLKRSSGFELEVLETQVAHHRLRARAIRTAIEVAKLEQVRLDAALLDAALLADAGNAG